MKYIVDRIVNNIAILETDDGNIEVDCFLLPENVREGSVLVSENGRFFVDEASERDRKSTLFLLQEKLKNKNS